MQIKVNISLKVGRIVKFLVLVDLALLGGWGLMEPIFPIFIHDQVAGATLTTIGVSAAIYWVLKSVLQLPIANFLDRTPGDKMSFYTLELALLLAALAAFSFSWVTTVPGLYLVQVLHAVAFAFYIPSWSGVFARHLDSGRISFDWSLDSTAVGISAGLSGLAGSLVAARWGFTSVFVAAGIFTLASAAVLLFAADVVLPGRVRPKPALQDHTPASIGQ